MQTFAKKDHAEREDEETTRLVRPAPKLKPPRHDKKRETTDPDRDPDVDSDPDLKTKDKSLNYKVVGRSVVERYLSAQVKKVPAINKSTGDRVLVSPKTLKEKPGEYEEIKPQEEKPSNERKPLAEESLSDRQTLVSAPDPTADPSPKKKKPSVEKPEKSEKTPQDEGSEATSEKAPEEAPQDKKPEQSKKEAPKPETMAQKHGIPEPERRTASSEEYAQANMLLADVLPPKLAAKLVSERIHPDDAVELVSSYKSLRARSVGNLSDYANKVAKVYVSDPGQVTPPVVWKKEGKKVAFEELSPKEQAEAYRQHQMQVLAVGAAARQQIADKLAVETSKGTPVVPKHVAGLLADVMLQGDKLDEESVGALAKKVFETTAENGNVARVPPGTVKQLMNSVKGSEAATKVARSFLLANDYKQAKEAFLKSGQLSEKDSPGKIAKALQEARTFFAGRAKIYGDGQHQGQQHFENKVLERLRGLDPIKYEQVRLAVDHADVQAYKKAKKAYEKAMKAWRGKHVDTRGEPPEPPRRPPGMVNVMPADQLKEQGRSLWSDLMDRLGVSKTASIVTSRYLISSYLKGKTMDSQSRKTGMYHGIDPAENYPEVPYPGWGQAHQRDLSEADYEIILAGAQEWLKQPVLTQGEGLLRDQQTRSALDLAIQASPYNRQIDVTTYNILLARLQGVPEPGLDQSGGMTLQASQGPKLGFDRSQVEKAVFKKLPPDSKQKSGGKLKVMLTGDIAKVLHKEDFTTVFLSDLSESDLKGLAKTLRVKTSSFVETGDCMTPSQELRQLATKVASKDARLGYELLDVAGRVAAAEKVRVAVKPTVVNEDTRYASLRSTLIKTAQSVSPQVRAAFKPLLQAVKDLG